jgi:hypothetical protein
MSKVPGPQELVVTRHLLTACELEEDLLNLALSDAVENVRNVVTSTVAVAIQGKSFFQVPLNHCL